LCVCVYLDDDQNGQIFFGKIEDSHIDDRWLSCGRKIWDLDLVLPMKTHIQHY
jgi:hypothetical protein